MTSQNLKMAALGRRFQLGNLYDYRNDRIADEQVNWETTDLERATEVETNFAIKLSCQDSESHQVNNKWEFVGLNEHLQASTASGIIDKYRGASNFLNDKINLSQASRVLVLRAKSRKERLNLKDLPVEDLPRLVESAKATHIVVGINYGAEAYCVLTQDIGNNLDDEEARDEADDNLSDLATKIVNALDGAQSLSQFQEQFNKEEKQQLTKIKCRLYADLQTQAVKECSVVDAYKHCLKLIEQVQPSDDGKSLAVPISVSIRPLKQLVINPARGIAKLLQYRDVDVEVVQRFCRILTELGRVIGEAEFVRSHIDKSSRTSLRTFIEAIGKFQDILKKKSKAAILKARSEEEGEDGDEELANLSEMADRHPQFKPSRLDRWLRYKKTEADILEKIKKTKGIDFFTSLKSLTNELADSDKKYALVLSIPPVDQRTKDILAKIKDSLKSNNASLMEAIDADSEEEEEEDDDKEGLPWHMIARKRKQVLDKIRELADCAEKNKHLMENQVHFLMAISDSDKGLCRYSVYEYDNLLKNNIGNLPGPPSGFKFKLNAKTAKKSASIRVEWIHQDLGFPTHFLVEYRSKDADGSKSWIQKRTAIPGENYVTIILKDDELPLEFRVATDTCIGRSEFSIVTSTDSDLDDPDDEEATMEVPKTEPSRLPRKADRMAIDRQDCIEMATLGRRFKLGQLYDYLNDRITDDCLQLEFDHGIDEGFTLKLDVIEADESKSKWDIMGLDQHLQASTMAGLVDKFFGASNYLNDKTSTGTSQVRQLLALRAVTRNERWTSLHNPIDMEVVRSNAAQSTHLVVGATYGAEAYCVMFQEPGDDKESREDAQENLSSLSNKLTRSIRANENWEDLKFNREEKEILKRTKCRLYSDCQTQTVKECSVIDAYKHILKLIERIQHSGDAVPISVSLCPLKRLIDPAKGNGNVLQSRDVDADLISRCCRIWVELERVSSEAESLRSLVKKNKWMSLRSFVESIDKFKDLLRKGLKANLVKAREASGDDDEINKIVDIVEKHPLFNPCGLNRWLEYKKAERGKI